MDLPEAQAKIKDMDVDFAHWFDNNPWNKTAKAKGEFLEWMKSLIEAQQVLDAEIVSQMSKQAGCGNCGQPLYLGIIEQKILNQNKWKITSPYGGYMVGIMRPTIGNDASS